MSLAVLCIASYEKGHEFLRECKRQGCHVILLTSQSLKDDAQWPAEAIDEIFYMPDTNKQWNREDTIKAVSFLARTRQIERLVPLDDFDLEMAASLREHLRIAGMGETTTRYFRDKLANRMRAHEAGLNVPDFVHILNHHQVQSFLGRNAPPWVLKPRSSAGAIGIKLIQDQEQFWETVKALGDEQSHYLVEQYLPGDVFHVDSIVYEKEILFAVASGYGHPPMDVSHRGGIFTTRILERGSATEQALLAKNKLVLGTLGLQRGVSHTEFIRGREDGTIYFLETSARVGGAHISELVEAATGVNLWAEWAKVEIAGGKKPYQVTPLRAEYAGLLVSLSKQEVPDTSAYADPEVTWRLIKKHHVGFIVHSESVQRVNDLLSTYVSRVKHDFWASVPPSDRPHD